MTAEDDFVEKLLKDLPKAPPMSDLEIRRFEKHVDSLVEAEDKKKVSKGWSSQFAAAASIVVLVAGVAIFANSSEIINPQKKQPSDVTSASPAPTSGNTQEGNTGQNPGAPRATGSNSGDSGITNYGNSKSPNPTESTGSIPVLNTGIDYASAEQSARIKVKGEAVRGDIKLLNSRQIACSVKLGIDEELFAIDKGTYAGEDIEAFYFGDSKNALKIKIVGFGCELIETL